MAARAVKNLELDFIVICDYALISRENKLSILGIFDQIFVNNTPSQHPKMFIVGILKGEANAVHNLKLRLKDPSGKDVLPDQELKVVLGANGNSNFIAELNNLPLNLTGSYMIELLTDDKLLAKKKFNVFRAKSTGFNTVDPKKKMSN